nr:putative reverse transcriptase domain-containing protein [Tanacetum cinerariifolium]
KFPLFTIKQVVSEFSDVFQDEFPGIPPVREVEFNIELIPGSEPISKATTLATTTRIPVMDVTRGTGVSSPTNLLVQVHSSPGVPLRATPTQDLPLQFDDKIRTINALPLDMCKFDIILDELPGIPTVHEVEFNIKLILGSEPISKAPYRMAQIELKELKDQLQEL